MVLKRRSTILDECSIRLVSVSCFVERTVNRHAKGLFSHAARHYEKALEIAEERAGGIPKVRIRVGRLGFRTNMLYREAGSKRKPRITCL